LLYGVNNIAEDFVNRKIRKIFKQDLIKSISNVVQPNWNQVKIIAETNSLQRKDLSRVLKLIITEIFSGESSLKADNIPLLEGYLESHSQEEPFEGIPSEIKIHLERLKENSDITMLQLEPLTKHISELLKINSSEKKRQKAFSIISFLIGIGGFAIGLYQLIMK
jgi:predicted nucleic acid-binding Zn ribbon protein